VFGAGRGGSRGRGQAVASQQVQPSSHGRFDGKMMMNQIFGPLDLGVPHSCDFVDKKVGVF